MIENSQLKEHMAAVLGEPILTITSVAGGDIAQSYLVTTRSQYKVFAKTQAEHGDMLLKEAVGLKEIAASGAIRVPQVLHVEHGLLVLEAIVAPRRADTTFFRAFGAALARMHKVHADFFGFHEDNYIGSTEQKNLPKISYDSSQGDHQGWARFFFEYRLLFQYRLLERKGYTDDFKKAFLSVENRVMTIIGERDNEAPALLHGDLWNGNYLVTEQGEPCLIDPAVYYGDREADLAMTSLFGGFHPEFYRSYQEEYPQLSGYSEREPIYQLYHVMNHANMFGRSYYSQLRSLLNSLV